VKTIHRRIPFVPFFPVISVMVVLGPVAMAPAANLDDAVELAREYLETTDSQERSRLSRELAAYDRDWKDVIQALRPRPDRVVKPGYYKEEHFTQPQLRKKHPEDLLYFVVPTSYCPERPTGLVVFMHGGGKGSLRTAPDRYMTTAGPDTPLTSSRLGDLFEAVGMIGVGPSAPWNEKDHQRWCLPEADEYLADVIRECKTRLNVDPDRVFLFGHSMGGFGAYHQVQRQPDRFAAVIASAGAWGLAHWPVIRGTTFCIVHGVADAKHGVRDRSTDIGYARWADELLCEKGIPHVYKEHPEGHPMGYGKQHILEFFEANRDLRRDPFVPHVVLASPVGWVTADCQPVRHNRWITLDATREGPLEYDTLRGNGKSGGKDCPIEEWSQWELRHKTVDRNGASIEAINRGENRLEVTTANVSRLTLWLHPEMVDFSKPIQIELNGKPHFDGQVTLSLATLLESFERRRDWGLVYPAKITLDVTGEDG
jgi:predicted esterase